jgi:hypothetical protein
LFSTIQAIADWIPIVVGITTAICIFVLAPLGIFRATRAFAGIGLVTGSWILGAILWIYGAAATFAYWGLIGVVIGIVFFGVGVVPMGFLALALQSQWEWFWNLGILFASVIISRIGGGFLIEAAERRKADALR